MKLTNKGRYAVMAMADLASNAKNGPISLSEISIRQNISLAYLEQIFSFLRKAGILAAVRGPKGGFKLSRPSAEIMIGEIIVAVEKNMDATQCAGEGICNAGSKCIAHNFWMDFNENVNEFLMNKSLEDVLSKRRGNSINEHQVLRVTG